jgi:hypothetical protein
MNISVMNSSAINTSELGGELSVRKPCAYGERLKQRLARFRDCRWARCTHNRPMQTEGDWPEKQLALCCCC